MKATRNYLAFDLGASHGRAILGEFDGARLTCRKIYQFPNDPVLVHQHLHWDVLRLFHEIKNGLAKFAGDCGCELHGIGIDTWGVDTGLFAAAGSLLGNPHHYRDDRFAGAEAEIRERLDAFRLFAETGTIVQRVTTIAQMYVQARDHAPQFEAAQSFLMIPSVFNYFLTGVFCDEQANISNTGLVKCGDGKAVNWALKQLGIPKKILPPVAKTGTIIGNLTGTLEKELGLSQVPVVACASHDTASAVIAMPADETSRWAFISCGTWSVVGVETDRPVLNRAAYQQGLLTAGTSAGRFMTRLNQTGLWLGQECRRIWAQTEAAMDWDSMVQMAQAAPPFTAFLDVDDPAFTNPPNMPEAIHGYLARTKQRTPADKGTLLRIVFESMALKYREALLTIDRIYGRETEVVHMAGGGTQNRLLCQFTANALGLPVLAGPVDATAAGNLVIQMLGAGDIRSVAEGRRLVRASFDLTEYQPQDVDRWREVYAIYQKTVQGGREQ